MQQKASQSSKSKLPSTKPAEAETGRTQGELYRPQWAWTGEQLEADVWILVDPATGTILEVFQHCIS
jgi:hypothetical protein